MKHLRKLIVGISTVALTGLSLFSTTYAWFQINSTAVVSGFDFDVTGGLGFQVSVDGTHYYHNLSSSQMRMAMVHGYNKNYKFSKDGNSLEYAGQQVTDATINKIIANDILLYPVTSEDGRVLKNLSGSTVSPKDGRYVQLNLYFKAVSDKDTENQKYAIYLTGDKVISSGMNEGQIASEDNTTDKTVAGTYIKSNEVDHVELLDDMRLVTKDNVVKSLSQDNFDYVNVYSSNAMRFSMTSSTYVQETSVDEDDEPLTTTSTIETDVTDPVGPIVTEPVVTEPENEDVVTDIEKTLIYELNQEGTENISGEDVEVTNLGSFATTYENSKVFADGDEVTELEKAYCANINAMYTYYNNIKKNAKLTEKLIDYNEDDVRLNTLKYADITNGNGNKHVITTVESGGAVKQVTCRFWLEGWDADCFDGLSSSINVHLLFNSTKVYSGE